MIQQLKAPRNTTVKSRSQAIVTLKTLIMNAPVELYGTLDQNRGKADLIRHIATFSPGHIDNTLTSAKASMRA